MKVLHITPSTKGYEVVTLIANRVNRNNCLAVIEKHGKQNWTGGFILNLSIRNHLDLIPKKEQYNFVKEFKTDPFVKFYLEED
jgi:hypothetical protein